MCATVRTIRQLLTTKICAALNRAVSFPLTCVTLAYNRAEEVARGSPMLGEGR